MLKDCQKGKIDIILTKSLSRFGRNTVDTLITLHRLAEKNIAVHFEMEGINSMDKNMRQAIRMIAAISQEAATPKVKISNGVSGLNSNREMLSLTTPIFLDTQRTVTAI